MSVSDLVASSVLAKCGRHCCICRRYRPTFLQVHHIDEVSQGGSDEEDNLIALCITCHSDVHTKRPFARRFTSQEQRQHRDNVYKLVEDGRLVPGEEVSVTTLLEQVGSVMPGVAESAGMMREAKEVLIASSESKNGDVIFCKSMRSCSIIAGDFRKELTSDRERALYEAVLEQLTLADLLEQRSWDHGGLWKMTHRGYLLADELSAQLVCGETTSDPV